MRSGLGWVTDHARTAAVLRLRDPIVTIRDHIRELPGRLADLESSVPAQWLGFGSQSASREAKARRSRGHRARLTACQPSVLDRLKAANSTKASS